MGGLGFNEVNDGRMVTSCLFRQTLFQKQELGSVSNAAVDYAPVELLFVVLTNLGSVPLNRSHVVDEDKADVVSLTSSGYGNPNLRNMCSRVDKLSENMTGMTEWRLYFVVCSTKSMRNGGYEVIKKAIKYQVHEEWRL